MTYMQSNLAFASGIQELSVDEIGFVGGGVSRPETPKEKAARLEEERERRAVLCEIFGGIAGVVTGAIVATATAPFVSPVVSTVAGGSMGVAVSATATASCKGPVTHTPNR
jgi:hypothetical protein